MSRLPDPSIREQELNMAFGAGRIVKIATSLGLSLLRNGGRAAKDMLRMKKHE
jgi:hypothetical protein